ncbi:MAG: 1-acyl-sn-glycerol-3-phosphate acyltransferase [Clostridia bacterium]|nr:1-acyl-sn-glycerol-3-phosphate acyltransferase [Clostridia bacterium]
MSRKEIPIFFACDDNFVKFTLVSLYSIKKNASEAFDYKIYVLHTGITGRMMNLLYDLADEHFSVVFRDVTEYLKSISDKLPLRDYYSKTTYYRLYIAELYPEYSKVIYIDSDTVVQGDISELYNTDIGDCFVGACHEQAMVQTEEFGKYVESVVGINRHNFFNAGLLLINCDEFRAHLVLDKFIHYLNTYNFVVTQDEDYLNLICKDHVYWLDQRWNTEVFGEIPYPPEEAKMIHYIMVNKPWHYDDCRMGDIFWAYAKETAVYDEIKAILDNYTNEQKKRDAQSAERLLALAVTETNREDNFYNRVNAKRDQGRVAIVKKIEEYEKAGRFAEDVEDDPPTKPLLPDDINYLSRNPLSAAKTKLAFAAARRFVDNLIAEKKLIIKEIKGIENFDSLHSGAIITCNHFNAFDSFAIQMAYEASNQRKRRFYRVIREGNYTSFPGFYGFLMRHCYTLPLASNHKTLKKFMEATDTVLKSGHFVLVYPEQSMWWNYRKPKPLKNGAFMFACRNNVPVLPCFITMRDTDIVGDDGFFVQEYTIHIGKPIKPDKNLPYTKAVTKLAEENYNVWKEIYEKEYGIPLYYTTEK